MKRLKRRLSAAFRPHSTIVDNPPYHDSGSFTGPPCHPMQMHTSHSVPSYMRASSITLSDSISELAERLASEGVIMEESDGTNIVQMNGNGCDRGFRYDAAPSGRYPYRSVSYHHGVDVHPELPNSTSAKILMRPKKKEKEKEESNKSNGRINSWHSSRCETNGGGVGGPVGRRVSHAHHHHNGLFYGHHRAVVHEGSALGSDGESVEASPCTSDEVTSPERYVVNVKMRSKPTRRWSEQDIQKRLSLPADLRLPLSVVEKLNRTPTLDQPLTRKNRRASLSEIGFGKLETYQKLEKLGEGTYATVYKGRSRLTENYVALKEIRLEQEEGAPCTAIREVSLLRDLRHANVVTLHDIIHTERLLTLVFEYVDRDLKQYMDACGNIMSIGNVRIFLIQLLRGLSYCHRRRVLHRDLKPQNLLINQNGELKLADFGLARAKSVPTKTYSHEVVTLWYRPPDVLLGATDYSTHIDMWGVGCILYEMVAGRPFFPGSSAEEQLHLIFRALGTPRPDLHPTLCDSKEFKSYAFPRYHSEPLVNHAPRLDADGLDLLAKLLQYEGRKRISATDGMRHQFFRSLPLAIFDVPDNESIFTVPGLHLTRDPGTKSASHMMLHGARPGKNRRQSMLL